MRSFPNTHMKSEVGKSAEEQERWWSEKIEALEGFSSKAPADKFILQGVSVISAQQCYTM